MVGMQIRFSTVQVVGAVLTVLAVLALSVSPAFGQAIAIDEGDDVQYNAVCQNTSVPSATSPAARLLMRMLAPTLASPPAMTLRSR
jgi:hypothetical protein